LMLRLVVLLVLTFALEWLPGLLAAVSAMGLGFVIGVVRVAMLALMLDQPSTFAYWHGETGSGFFSGVTLLLLGGLCYALLDGDRNLPDDALDSQSVSPSSSRGLITTLPGAIAAMATVCAAGLAIFNPAIGRRSVSPFQFPHAIRLPPYQFLGSQALKNKPVGVDFVLAARRYHYAIAETPFTIEMRYLIGTRGNVAGNLGNLWHPLEFPKIHFPILREHQNPEVGSYGVLEKDGQTHLNACITPSGRSTLTPKQFLGDRTEAQASLPDLLAVINGQTPWRDQRCLWVLLSTPTVPDAHTTELKLEALWLAWYHHWQDQFPPL
jgi:cyanosortase A-associated protein